MRKKRVLFQSDYSLAKTGFGRNARTFLSYLYSTGKYDILHYCGGINVGHAGLDQTPWKSVGTLPNNPAEREYLQRDGQAFRMASYGLNLLDETVTDFKPDVYIAAQDIWGVDFAVDKDWFPYTNSVIWTTLDSLPILPAATKIAPKVSNYWIWSEFATKSFHEMGHEHVKTMHGPLDDKYFYKINEEDRLSLRNKNSIAKDDFIIGFVFRNQLRKSVPNLLEGFKKFKESGHQYKNAKLLLHTHFSEGWDIVRLAKEYGVLPQDILTTYVCDNCKAYEVTSFDGQKRPCKVCGAKSSMETTNVDLGVKEHQLNEVYNLMDVYIHPFTSGGQEFPIQEAKLAELITLVTDYSCGEDLCVPEAYSKNLNWTEYREHGTEFRKASTSPDSITEKLIEVFEMSKDERDSMGKKAREWTLKNYSIEVIGKKICDFIDDCEYTDERIYLQGQNKNPKAEIDDSLDEDEWLMSLYKNILDRVINEKDDGFAYWKSQLKKDVPREDIEKYFRAEASKTQKPITDFLDDEGKDGRVIVVMPQTATDVFLITSLFSQIKSNYPNCNLYVATQKEYMEILDGNPEVHKVIPYFPEMENILWLEGSYQNEGYFKVAYLPHFNTQKAPVYQHNGKDVKDFETII